MLRVKIQQRLVSTRIPLKLIELLQMMLKSVPRRQARVRIRDRGVSTRDVITARRRRKGKGSGWMTTGGMGMLTARTPHSSLRRICCCRPALALPRQSDEMVMLFVPAPRERGVMPRHRKRRDQVRRGQLGKTCRGPRR